MKLHVRDLTRRFPTIVIVVAAILAVFAVLLADEGDRYVFTFAGTGEAGAGGDGGPATEAQLSEPRGLAVDGSGNLYVADSGNHRIRRIDAEGVITTIAGTGVRGFSGDGSPATEAQFAAPTDLAVDGSGNLYVADSFNYRIRRIDAEGVITTIAGTGVRGFSGDGGPATEAQFSTSDYLAADGSGNLYVADSGNHRIRRIDAEGVITTIAGTGIRGFSGDGSPATEAQFAYPSGLAFDDSGNFYVADSGNSRIRRIDAEGMVTTIAGSGPGFYEGGYSGDGGPATEAQFAVPGSLALDGSGNLYVSDSHNDRIRRIDAQGVITTVAGSGPVPSLGGYSGDGGPATEAQFAVPRGLAVDGSGNLYVADSGNLRIRVIRPPGERNPVTNEFPHFANGDSTVSDLVLVNVDTKTVTPMVRFFSSEGGPISADSLLDVTGDLEVTADGALAVTAGIPPLAARTISTHGRGALMSGSVRVVSDGYIGGFLRFDSMAVGVAGVGAAQPVNDALFPARRKEGGINTGTAVRNLEAEAVTMTCHLIQGRDVLATTPVELAGGGQQARFINELFPEADTSDFEGSVRCTAPEGKMFTGVALEMDAGNRIFTTLPLVAVTATLDGDVEKPYVFTFAGTGKAGAGGDGGPATEAQFAAPGGLAVDGSGNLYVSDFNGNRIRRIDAEGVITTIAGTGVRGFSGDGGPATEAQFAVPRGLAVDGSGNLFVVDSSNYRIRRIDAGGMITTIAGTGGRGFSGDGGPATEAQFAYPRGLAVDGSGNLYVADSSNYRIRRIDAEGVITTIAGTGVRGFSGDGGPATEAQFAAPTTLAVDGSGNLYVTDLSAIRIRRIDAGRVITTLAGSGPGPFLGGYSGDGGPATEAQFAVPRGLAVDGSGNLYVADSGNLRIRVIRPPGERNPVTNEFPHFANGDSTVSDLVLVNVDTKTVTPMVRFFSSEGDPISADSLLDVTGDLEVTADGALAVTAGIPPLAARTISTHGRGALMSGSVRVVSDGYIGGFLRFDSMAVGVAGVGAAQPVNDALFPARRKEGGINTGTAVRNLEAEAVTMTCHLIQGRDVLATTPVELAGGGQQARFINELFPEADTSDFEGSVRCTAPEGKMFTGVALEMDAGNRIFTTLPLVPVLR